MFAPVGDLRVGGGGFEIDAGEDVVGEQAEAAWVERGVGRSYRLKAIGGSVGSNPRQSRRGGSMIGGCQRGVRSSSADGTVGR